MFISVAMLYSFNIKEPHTARGHAYGRSSAAGISYTLLFMLKACAVLLTGIAVKIALYDPFAPADAPYALPQRQQFSMSIGICFGLQLLMRPLHSSVVRHQPIRQPRDFRAHR